MALPIFIKLDEVKGSDLQTRVALDEETLQEYAEIYREDEFKMPPVEAMMTDLSDQLLLTDGYHRVEAARRAGRTRIRCLLSKGTPTDALKAALKANSAHGLRRTNADKRKALALAWERREELFGGEPSNALLAQACGVSERWVIKMRPELAGSEPFTPCERIGTNGKHYTNAKSPAAGVLVDHVGREVPERLIPVFRSKAVLKAVNQMSKALRELELLRQQGETLEMAFVSSHHLYELSNHLASVRRARPYAVCPACNGEGCRDCRGFGFLPKAKYEALTHEIEHVGGVENLSPINTISTNTDSSNSSSKDDNLTEGGAE